MKNIVNIFNIWLKDSCLCAIIQELLTYNGENEVKTLGYRDFAKDYKIEYTDVPGRKRPRATRVYVGPWYRFTAQPERIRFLKVYYLVFLILSGVFLLIPMLIDCAFTRAWFIQTPVVASLIPWIFACCATWRLWTAGERVTREHNELLGPRMSGAALFLMGLSLVSCMGCIRRLTTTAPAPADLVVSGCCLLCFICGVAMFARRKELNMSPID